MVNTYIITNNRSLIEASSSERKALNSGNEEVQKIYAFFTVVFQVYVCLQPT